MHESETRARMHYLIQIDYFLIHEESGEENYVLDNLGHFIFDRPSVAVWAEVFLSFAIPGAACERKQNANYLPVQHAYTDVYIDILYRALLPNALNCILEFQNFPYSRCVVQLFSFTYKVKYKKVEESD